MCGLAWRWPISRWVKYPCSAGAIALMVASPAGLEPLGGEREQLR